MTFKETAGILTVVAGMFGALIAGLPQIMEAYGTLTKDNIESATDQLAQKLAKENSKKIDSLYSIGQNEFLIMRAALEELSKKKGFAVTIRKDNNNIFDDPDRLLYRATDGNTYPAYWKEEYMFWTYRDLRDDKEHPIWYEDKLTLEQLKHRAEAIYGAE